MWKYREERDADSEKKKKVGYNGGKMKGGGCVIFYR